TALGAGNVRWNTNETSPVISVSATGTYSVTLTNASSCTATASVVVSEDVIPPSVSITASPSLTITQGQSATLTALVSGEVQPLSLRWSTNQTDPAIVVSQAGSYSVVVTAPNGCTGTASVVLSLTTAPVDTSPFAITGVTTISCTPVLPNRYSLSFAPRYSGLTGQPISFSVVNELFPTTDGGPYTIRLYTDNPRITLSAVQAGTAQEALFVYDWLAACQASESSNTPPTVVMSVPPQSATVGVGYSYVIPAGTFSDAQTPGSLLLSAKGLPPGIGLSGYTLSGTPSTTVGSPYSVTLTATDPGGLSVSTLVSLVVSPASGPVGPTPPFAITGVTTISCTPTADRINISFVPQYVGVNGQAIAFGVVNELLPTNEPGPYSLTLYRDNPVITLRATQTGSTEPASFSYHWLAACMSQGNDNTPPRVVSPVTDQTLVVGQMTNLNLQNVFGDQETPGQLSLSAQALPAGLRLEGPSLMGVPTGPGSTTVVLVATDPQGL
ncbi:putative Ig domain-containing protein, partial [Spirosoma soli]